MIAFTELIVAAFSFIFLIIFLHRWLSSTPRKRLLPSPMKLPIIGNFHQLGAFPHRSLQALSKRYGELMLLHFWQKPVLIASSANAAREITKTQDLIFANRPKLGIPDRLHFGTRDIAFSPYGEYWRQVRSICILHLLSNKKVQSFRCVREEEASLMLEKIRKSGSGIVNLRDVLVSFTNDVFCRMALGKKDGEDGKVKMSEKVNEFLELLGTFNVGDYIPWLAWINRINGFDAKVEKTVKFFDGFLEGVIEEHRDRIKEDKDHSRMDFVDLLLQIQRDNEGSSSPVEDDTIKALILEMFVGGTDTTATIIEWTMAELIKNPRTMRILQNEVRKVGGSKEDIYEEDLDKMTYLKAVIKESLRLHLPSPLLIPHELTQDTKVLGYEIKSGTQVLINAWAICRDPLLWRNPEEFIPERFLNSGIDFKGLHFEFIPFGSGRRSCPGLAFAMAIEELAIAKLVHKFNFALPNGGKEEDLDMSEAYAVTVHKKHPLLVVTT